MHVIQGSTNVLSFWDCIQFHWKYVHCRPRKRRRSEDQHERHYYSSVVGNGTSGYIGDNGPATSALLFYPSDVVFDTVGNLFIADLGNYVVRKNDRNGTITTEGLEEKGSGVNGDYGPATNAIIGMPAGLAKDTLGKYFF